MDAAITCKALTKRYGTVLALDSLSLEVPRNVVFGFLGPNGAGKTTTMRILAGLSAPTSGAAYLDGCLASPHDPASRRRVGYLPEEPSFYGWMSAREYLLFVGGLLGLAGREAAKRADELLELVDLREVAKRRIAGFSRGMRQRLGIAQALVGRPEVLLLDEPSSALDPLGRRDVLALIERLAGQTTVFISTHILADVERVCQQVAIVAHGRLMAQADQEALRQRYATPIFEIETAAEAPELVERLRAEPWVERIDREATVLRLTVRDEQRARRELPQLIAGLGEQLVRYQQARPTIEDVFVRLVEA
ncbi:MAG TPA: ABC transporter ATP-binding protein [Anaerolineae bacterium]|nr:ABC transporter ATP-binding protein [Anaerolineae bacterium]HOR00180.1 ABC transporter ATP-binding protein [Anaerolineae bacterium]